MINFVIDKNFINKKEIVYAIFYLTENFNTEVQIAFASKDECINVFYGVKPDKINSVYIPLNREFTECYNTFFEKKQSLTSFNFDIIYSSFYLLACKEEYDIKTRDSMDRFLSSFSLREKHINIPLFDVYSKAIYDALSIYYENLDFKQKKFRICLTHDVDNIDSRNRYIFLHNVKSLLTGNKNKLLYNFKVLSLQMFTNQFKQINNYMNLEESYGAKSEFYFIQGKKHRFGSRYSLKQAYGELMDIKNKDKFIIGLHTNFFSFDDSEKIEEEKSLIENCAVVKIKSCRNHYLKFTIPDTWMKLKDAGIKFDTTIGYSDRNGFRAGTSKAFVPFNILKQDIVDIYEIPLILMDVSIMEKPLSFQEKWEEIKLIIDRAKEYIGTASIVWHENVLTEKEYREMYERILGYIKHCNGEFVTHEDLEEKFNNQREELIRLFSMLE